MSRIKRVFEELKEKGEGALIAYLTLGDPDLESSKEQFVALSKHADILEIGLPFSDPIADGPTIQAAMDRALKSGVTTDDAFEAVTDLRASGVARPIVFMTYYNIVFQYGEDRFLQRCREAGVDGLLVSDLPLEESESIVSGCRKYGLDPIFLIAPITPPERVKQIAAVGSGFLYLVSLLGVTGARESVAHETLDVVESTRRVVRGIPLAVGFGISRPEHVKQIISAGAEGVVVGSAFVNLSAKHGSSAGPFLEGLASELKEGTR